MREEECRNLERPWYPMPDFQRSVSGTRFDGSLSSKTGLSAQDSPSAVKEAEMEEHRAYRVVEFEVVGPYTLRVVFDDGM